MVCSCRSSQLRFAAQRTSISSAASGILGMLFSPRAATSKSATSAVGGRTPPRHSPSQALHSSLCGADQQPYTCTPFVQVVSMGSRWLYTCTSKIKRPSLFQVESNNTSRDVKGLFLGVRFVLRRVMVISWLGCSSRTSCMSRWGVVLEYVMGLMAWAGGIAR